MRFGGVAVAEVRQVLQVALDFVLHGLFHFLDSGGTIFVFGNLELWCHVLLDGIRHLDGLEDQIFARGIDQDVRFGIDVVSITLELF